MPVPPAVTGWNASRSRSRRSPRRGARPAASSRAVGRAPACRRSSASPSRAGRPTVGAPTARSVAVPRSRSGSALEVGEPHERAAIVDPAAGIRPGVPHRPPPRGAGCPAPRIVVPEDSLTAAGTISAVRNEPGTTSSAIASPLPTGPPGPGTRAGGRNAASASRRPAVRARPPESDGRRRLGPSTSPADPRCCETSSRPRPSTHA